MDANKLVAIGVFCAVSLIVSFFIPLLAKAWSAEKLDPKAPLRLDLEHWYVTAPAALALSTMLYFRMGTLFLAGTLALVLVMAFLKNPKPLLNAALVLFAALVTSYLPWWRITGHHISLSTLETFSVLAGAALVMLGLSWPATKSTGKPHGALAPKQWLLFAIFVAVAVIFVPYKGVILDRALLTTWHHWGAFIGPAQLVAEGVYPLHDIPVQYGFGPTVLSALSCSVLDCWSGFYWLNLSFVICFFAALIYAALCLSQRASLPAQIVILTCVALSALGWTMYPPNLISPLSTPSTSGLRFLPGTMMMVFLVRASLQTRESPARPRTQITGHLLWTLGLFWSPEAAIHTTFLWAPFFVWSTLFYGPRPASTPRFFRQAAILVGVLLAVLVSFVALFMLFFGEMPLWSMYTASLRNPPGVLPIDFKASIWAALICYALWFASLWAAHRAGMPDRSTLASWVTMLFALVTFTYFLGRSHSNNILNLLPYFSILLVAIRSSQTAWAAQHMANLMLAGFIGVSALFGLSAYNQAQSTAGYFAHQSASIPARMSYQDTSNVTHFAMLHGSMDETVLSQQKDLREALSYIRNERDEPVEIFDLNMLIDADSKYGPWSAIHPIATTYFSTSQDRITYLKNVMQRLNKSGWIVIKNDFALLSIIDEYNSVYEQTDKIEFGTYTAIRYSPKFALGTQ